MTPTKCRATALLYSGRPDPEWSVDDEQLKSLEHIWNELSPSTSATAAAPPLGYRGLTLVCSSDKCWFAYGGNVTFKHGTRRPQHRLDEGRRFERALANTAPPDVLPQLLELSELQRASTPE
jgi:hypothetical protein